MHASNTLFPKVNTTQTNSTVELQTKEEFNRLLVRVVKQESSDNIHYQTIHESLIDFLKLCHANELEADFTANQVIELAVMFQKVVKIKNSYLTRLLEISSNLRDSATLEQDELNGIMGQNKCLDEFSSCINLQVIAKRLSSGEVCVLLNA